MPAPTVFARTPDSLAVSTPKPDAASSKKKKMKHVEKKKTYVEKKKREINNVFTEAKYAEDDAKWVADHGRSVAVWVMRSRKAAPPLLSAIMEKKVQQRRTDGPSMLCWSRMKISSTKMRLPSDRMQQASVAVRGLRHESRVCKK